MIQYLFVVKSTARIVSLGNMDLLNQKRHLLLIERKVFVVMIKILSNIKKVSSVYKFDSCYFKNLDWCLVGAYLLNW